MPLYAFCSLLSACSLLRCGDYQWVLEALLSRDSYWLHMGHSNPFAHTTTYVAALCFTAPKFDLIKTCCAAFAGTASAAHAQFLSSSAPPPSFSLSFST